MSSLDQMVLPIIHVKGFHQGTVLGLLKYRIRNTKKILADRVKRIKENEKLKQEMMKDQDLVEEVKQNTKRLMQ